MIKIPITPQAISGTTTKTAIIAALFFQKLEPDEVVTASGLEVGETDGSVEEDVERMSLVSMNMTDGVGSSRGVGLLLLLLVMVMVLVLVLLSAVILVTTRVEVRKINEVEVDSLREEVELIPDKVMVAVEEVGVGSIELDVSVLEDVVAELELEVGVDALTALRANGLVSKNEEEPLFTPSENVKMNEMQARTLSTINVDQRVVAVISITCNKPLSRQGEKEKKKRKNKKAG
jgi:hypothetical protein